MRVRNPEPVVIGWSFRPAAMISVVTPSIIRWAANSSARLFRPSLSRVGGDEVAFAADQVTTSRISQKEPRLKRRKRISVLIAVQIHSGLF